MSEREYNKQNRCHYWEWVIKRNSNMLIIRLLFDNYTFDVPSLISLLQELRYWVLVRKLLHHIGRIKQTIAATNADCFCIQIAVQLSAYIWYVHTYYSCQASSQKDTFFFWFLRIRQSYQKYFWLLVCFLTASLGPKLQVTVQVFFFLIYFFNETLFQNNVS